MRLHIEEPVRMIIVRVIAACAMSTFFASGAVAQADDASGAGASFPAAVYKAWTEEFRFVSGKSIVYQATGSSDGVKQIVAGSVTFAGTDRPLSREELAKSDLIQFPTLIGGIVPVVNIPGVQAGQLKLTGPLLARIFLG